MTTNKEIERDIYSLLTFDSQFPVEQQEYESLRNHMSLTDKKFLVTQLLSCKDNHDLAMRIADEISTELGSSSSFKLYFLAVRILIQTRNFKKDTLRFFMNKLRKYEDVTLFHGHLVSALLGSVTGSRTVINLPYNNAFRYSDYYLTFKINYEVFDVLFEFAPDEYRFDQIDLDGCDFSENISGDHQYHEQPGRFFPTEIYLYGKNCRKINLDEVPELIELIEYLKYKEKK